MSVFIKRVAFRHTRKGTSFVPQYHESVLAVSARSPEAAEKYFAKAIADSSERSYRLVYEGLTTGLEEPIGSVPVEVHSFTRLSELTPSEYRAQFVGDLRPRDCKLNGWVHARHKIDHVYSGCYNCRVRRKGRLLEQVQ